MKKGLIYKGSRIINWCPHCVTALSDAEVEYQDKPGHLWHIRYPLADGSGAVVVATTRPETMLGDSGVCVNPHDERYRSIVGKTVIFAPGGQADPRGCGRLCGDGIRHRLCQDDAGPRPQRL